MATFLAMVVVIIGDNYTTKLVHKRWIEKPICLNFKYNSTIPILLNVWPLLELKAYYFCQQTKTKSTSLTLNLIILGF